ncbi:MAG: Asp23/Gls24 family envelope stress response protein [Clostridia bacterium]|nr:Asp23/Gls24 family envelope stress response protein [Clostridia bacterium]
MYEEKVMDNTGKINISEEVIAVVAGVAASEVQGVAEMNNSLAGGITELLGKKNYSKGVKVVIEEEQVKISLSVTVAYGCNIPNVATEVQEKVKREVETMTSLKVANVDVFINAIAMPKVEKTKESSEK